MTAVENTNAAGPGNGTRKGPVIVGRVAELALMERLLAANGTSRGRVLVLRGLPGLGKTALLDHAAETTTGYRIIRARGVAAESELQYSGLQLICSSLLGGLGRLRPGHREALETAIGLQTGPPPDRFTVGVATLDLLAWAAEKQPLLCLVDDAQWLDRSSAQVLAFVARRLADAAVALFVAEQRPADSSEFAGLPELVLGALSPLESARLLDAHLATRVHRPVVERIVTEARGNPRVLLASVGAVSAAELAGYGVPYPREPTGGADGTPGQLDRLSTGARLLLVTAAADPLGDPGLLWRAAAHLGISPDEREQLDAGGMVSFGARVVFDDPRSRHSVYGRAPAADRRRAHHALALATDPVTDPDRRVWHLARAAGAPDDSVGDELWRCATRALQRGGLAAQAAFLEQSALLTADPVLRVERALTAAAVSHQAGAEDTAGRLLGIAELGPLDPSLRTRLAALRAHICFVATQGGNAVEPLLSAARRLGTLAPALAGPTYLDALSAATVAGVLNRGPGITEIAHTLREEASPSVDPLLNGLVARRTEGFAAAVEPLRAALEAARREGAPAARPPLLICLVAAELWDDDSWEAVTAVEVRRARQTGALATLPYALTHQALLRVHSGDLVGAAALLDEAKAIAGGAEHPSTRHAEALLAGWHGEERRALEVLDSVHRRAAGRGDGMSVAAAGVARAVLYNGLCRYGDALAPARRAGQSDEPAVLGWSLVELVEAAVRCGEPGIAAEAVERLTERTRSSGTEWALGIEARSRALLRDGGPAEELYIEAIERLGRCRITTQLARAQLLYGEWLRRKGRRVDARVPLRAAQRSFTAMGAQAFADRARRELLATGKQARGRVVVAHDGLTPQEEQIALLARSGLSNPEIGLRLSISARTVEYHLHKVFRKLDIASRLEIPLVLPDPVQPE